MRRVLFALGVAAVALIGVGRLAAGEAEDDVLARQIAANLKSSGQMNDFEVGIACMDGTAWLTGRVANQQQAAAAMQIARQTGGVQQVIDRMEITSGATGPAKQSSGLTGAIMSIFGAKNSSSRRPADLNEVNQASAVEPEVPAPLVPQAATQRQAQPIARHPAAQPAPLGMPYVPTAPPAMGQPIPAYVPGMGGQAAPAQYDQPHMPGYAWPSYAAYPNYAALTYPRQYSPTAWPYIGPFYPYPQVPLGWRKVTLEWDDGWWMLDFKD